MTLIRVSSRDREVVLAVELEFLLDDPEWTLRNLTFNGPVEDIIGDLRDILREFRCGDDLLDFWEWGFVVGPVENRFSICRDVPWHVCTV